MQYAWLGLVLSSFSLVILFGLFLLYLTTCKKRRIPIDEVYNVFRLHNKNK